MNDIDTKISKHIIEDVEHVGALVLNNIPQRSALRGEGSAHLTVE